MGERPGGVEQALAREQKADVVRVQRISREWCVKDQPGDAAAVLAVILEEPERPALLAATAGAVLFAPGSLPWEVDNALVAAVRRRRLTAAQAAAGWTAYQAIPIRLMDVDISRAMALASERGLYA